jgi:hypothetical protein
MDRVGNDSQAFVEREIASERAGALERAIAEFVEHHGAVPRRPSTRRS